MSVVNTFVAGNTITAAGHNTNNTDIAAEITNSLALDGQSTMTGQIKAANGTAAAPAISFGSDLDSGFYRTASNAVGLALAGASYIEITTASVSILQAVNIIGTFSVNGVVSTGAGAIVGGTLYVSATASIGGRLFVDGNATFRGNLTASATADFTGLVKAGLGVKVSTNPTASPGKAMTMQSLTATASSTYTTPGGVTWIRVRAIGGGGGGGGTGGSPGAGGTTTFNGVQAAGGSAGANTNGTAAGGAGGTGGAGSATFRIIGGPGGNGTGVAGADESGGTGGNGGGSVFGGAGGTNGKAASAFTGGGGGGAGPATAGHVGAGGGGSGEYFELVIGSPAATYDYACGSGGAAGTSGGAGAVGRIIVEEYYI